MVTHNSKVQPLANEVLGKATLRAAEQLGLRQSALSRVIGRDRSSIFRSGIDPVSKSGELAALLIRCYRALAVMVNDNTEQIQHWLNTPNAHTGGVPADQLESIDGLVTVASYLDAIRAKL